MNDPDSETEHLIKDIKETSSRMQLVSIISSAFAILSIPTVMLSMPMLFEVCLNYTFQWCSYVFSNEGHVVDPDLTAMLLLEIVFMASFVGDMFRSWYLSDVPYANVLKKMSTSEVKPDKIKV